MGWETHLLASDGLFSPVDVERLLDEGHMNSDYERNIDETHEMTSSSLSTSSVGIYVASAWVPLVNTAYDSISKAYQATRDQSFHQRTRWGVHWVLWDLTAAKLALGVDVSEVSSRETQSTHRFLDRHNPFGRLLLLLRSRRACLATV